MPRSAGLIASAVQVEAHPGDAAPWLLTSQPDVVAVALSGQQLEDASAPTPATQVRFVSRRHLRRWWHRLW